MPDALTRLREADPAAHHDTAAPEDVLRAILATPVEAPNKRRRAPRLVLATGALAAAAVVAIAALPGSEHAPAPIARSLADRAYAATAPMADFITYTETTTVQTGGPPSLESRDTLKQWQYQDRMHNVMGTVQPRGEWTYEHDQDGGTFRTLMHNDKGGSDFQVTHKTDPGWDPDELEEGFKVGVTTLVDQFRDAIKGAQDLGETTFNGRPAHAYRAAPAAKRMPGDMTYYVDPKSAIPLGSTMDLSFDGGDKVTITTTVDRYEHLAPTPENLRLLDAPNIDAAAAK